MNTQAITSILERDKDGTWYYVHVSKEVRDTYKQFQHRGAIAITVIAGSSTWQASILPWADGSGQISINKKVREKEGFQLGQKIELTIVPYERH